MTKKALHENPREKKPLGRPKLRSNDCIRKDFEKITSKDQRNREWKEVVECRDE